jgi:hypothetical protein
VPGPHAMTYQAVSHSCCEFGRGLRSGTGPPRSEREAASKVETNIQHVGSATGGD